MTSPMLDLESIEPEVRAYRHWTPALLKQAELSADAGFLRLAADLCDTMFADDRIKAVLDKRTDALLGLKLKFEAGLDGRKGKKAIAAIEAGEDWWFGFKETEVKMLHAWGLMLGVGLAEIVWRYREDVGRTVPTLSVKDPRHLRWDPRKRKWMLTVVKPSNDNDISLGGTTEIEVTPGDGRWILFTPYGSKRPWRFGAYRALSRWALLKFYAIEDWGFYSNRQGHAVFVLSGVGGTDEQRRALARDLKRLGRNAVFPLTTGQDFKIIESVARAYEGFAKQIEVSDNAYAVTLLGENLTTQAGNASGTSATVHGKVALGRTKADAETLSTTFHDQALVWWALFNFGNALAAPWPCWDTTPAEDLKAKAAVVQQAAQGVQILVAGTLITKAEARQFLREMGMSLEDGVPLELVGATLPIVTPAVPAQPPQTAPPIAA